MKVQLKFRKKPRQDKGKPTLEKAKEEKVKEKPRREVGKEDVDAPFKRKSKLLEYSLVAWGILIVVFMVLFMWSMITTPFEPINVPQFPVI